MFISEFFKCLQVDFVTILQNQACCFHLFPVFMISLSLGKETNVFVEMSCSAFNCKECVLGPLEILIFPFLMFTYEHKNYIINITQPASAFSLANIQPAYNASHNKSSLNVINHATRKPSWIPCVQILDCNDFHLTQSKGNILSKCFCVYLYTVCSKSNVSTCVHWTRRLSR